MTAFHAFLKGESFSLAVNQIKSEWKRTPWLGPGEVQLGMGRHDGNVACPPAAQGVALFQKPWPRDAVSKKKSEETTPSCADKSEDVWSRIYIYIYIS